MIEFTRRLLHNSLPLGLGEIVSDAWMKWLHPTKRDGKIHVVLGLSSRRRFGWPAGLAVPRERMIGFLRVLQVCGLPRWSVGWTCFFFPRRPEGETHQLCSRYQLIRLCASQHFGLCLLSGAYFSKSAGHATVRRYDPNGYGPFSCFSISITCRIGCSSRTHNSFSAYSSSLRTAPLVSWIDMVLSPQRWEPWIVLTLPSNSLE